METQELPQPISFLLFHPQAGGLTVGRQGRQVFSWSTGHWYPGHTHTVSVPVGTPEPLLLQLD